MCVIAWASGVAVGVVAQHGDAGPRQLFNFTVAAVPPPPPPPNSGEHPARPNCTPLLWSLDPTVFLPASHYDSRGCARERLQRLNRRSFRVLPLFRYFRHLPQGSAPGLALCSDKQDML